MTTHRIEITQRHLDNANPDPMGRQAIIDALKDAGMTKTWIMGHMSGMTHPDGARIYYCLTTRLNGWQLKRMRNPSNTQPFVLILDDQHGAGWMEGEPFSSSSP